MLQIQDGPSVGQLLVAVLGAIPILGIMGWTAVKIFGPIGQAFSRRIAGDGDSGLLERRVDDLTAELDQLKHQLLEANERLDFTERMLAQERQPEQLRRGSDN